MNEELKTSEEWQKEYPNITVFDPDGWDRQKFAQSWNELITQKEFEKRVSFSTCKFKGPPAFWFVTKKELKELEMDRARHRSDPTFTDEEHPPI